MCSGARAAGGLKSARRAPQPLNPSLKSLEILQSIPSLWWVITLGLMFIGLLGTLLPLLPGTTIILGAAILGIWGGEVMTQVQFAMMGKLTCEQVATAVITHPTLAGGLSSLFSQVM